MDKLVVNIDKNSKDVAERLMGKEGSFDMTIGPSIIKELKDGRMLAINCMDEYTCFVRWDEKE